MFEDVLHIGIHSHELHSEHVASAHSFRSARGEYLRDIASHR